MIELEVPVRSRFLGFFCVRERKSRERERNEREKRGKNVSVEEYANFLVCFWWGFIYFKILFIFQ